MSVQLLNDLKQGTSEWHEWRRGGVGASDAAALLDASPYKTRRDLWCEKMGIAEGNDIDEWLAQKGHQVESLIRKQYQDKVKIEMKPICAQRDEIFRVSLDGYDKSHGVLEAKFVGHDVLKTADTEGKVPLHHYIQIQDQLYVTESDKAVWIGHDGKKSGIIVEIGRDNDLIKKIVNETNEFWEQVQNNVIPELGPKDTLYITDPEQAKLFEELAKLKKQKDEIDSIYKDLESELKSICTHPKVKCGSVEVQEIERKGSVDYSKVPEFSDLSKEYLDNFRKRSSVYKKISFKKEA